MSIQELAKRIKRGVEIVLKEGGLVAVIGLVALACFGLGRLSVLLENRPAIAFEHSPVAGEPLGPSGLIIVDTRTGLYYYPWCSGAQQTPEMYRAWFQSENAAKKAGNAPAKNCRGLATE